MSIEDHDFSRQPGDGSQGWVGALIVLVSAICTIGAILYGIYWIIEAIHP